MKYKTTDMAPHWKNWRQVSLALAAVCASGLAIAQVCATPGRDSVVSSISGVVNAYYPGTGALIAAASTSIPIGSVAPGGSGAIAPGDLLILVQMQGAEIDSSNSDCYGDGVGTAGCATRDGTTASYAGGNLSSNLRAGAWEYCTATTAAAASVGVVCAGAGGGTVNAYQASAATASSGAYSYQIVRVPQYSNVSLSGNVTPLEWNGSTGGVLALQASGTVTMAGFNLDASARGFRGGGVTFTAPYGPSLLDPVDGSSFYRAPTGVISGASPGGEREGDFKGEGIAGTPQLVYNGSAQANTLVDGYPNGSRGRGAPGNAGGGGNNQNGGGGGGGNGGAGGNGGGCWNDVSRPTTFRDCGGFGGDGASRAGNNLSLSVNRIIMGGGGGAGHPDGGGTNCDQGSWGGSGGGLVLLRAAGLSGAGNILANGANGFEPNFVPGNCTDAGGGAGAGGTIVVATVSGLAGRSLQAIGGNGAGSSYFEHGPGGGGGGGVIYVNTLGGAPSLSASGGSNGLDRNNRPSGLQDAWLASPGIGSVLAASTPLFGTTCSTVLSVSKTDGTSTVAAGSTTDYTITFTNTGATAADGALAKDAPSGGLSCTVLSCTPTTAPIAAACPAPALWANLFSPSGLAIPGLPALSAVSFVVRCGVTASGL